MPSSGTKQSTLSTLGCGNQLEVLLKPKRWDAWQLEEHTAQRWGWSCRTCPCRSSAHRRPWTGQWSTQGLHPGRGWGLALASLSWRAEGCIRRAGESPPGPRMRRLLWGLLKDPPAGSPPAQMPRSLSRSHTSVQSQMRVRRWPEPRI